MFFSLSHFGGKKMPFRSFIPAFPGDKTWLVRKNVDKYFYSGILKYLPRPYLALV